MASDGRGARELPPLPLRISHLHLHLQSHPHLERRAPKRRRRGRPPRARRHGRRGRRHRRTLRRMGIPCATASPTSAQPPPTPIPPMPGTDRRRSTRSADGGDGRRELAVLGAGLAVVDASADGGDGRRELADLGAGLAVVNATLRCSASRCASGSPPLPHCLRTSTDKIATLFQVERIGIGSTEDAFALYRKTI